MPKLSEILGEAYSQIPEDIQNKYKDVDLVDGSEYVVKTDYNNISGQLKAANTTIKNLQKANKDNETLQQTIKDHEETIETLKTERDRDKKEFSIKAALKDAGCKDPDYLIFKYGGIDKFETDEIGKVKDFDNIIKSYKESTPVIFEEPKIISPKPGDGKSTPGNNNLATKIAEERNKQIQNPYEKLWT